MNKEAQRRSLVNRSQLTGAALVVLGSIALALAAFWAGNPSWNNVILFEILLLTVGELPSKTIRGFEWMYLGLLILAAVLLHFGSPVWTLPLMGGTVFNIVVEVI